MIRWDSYYFLLLMIPALFIFYIITTWLGCIPISEIESYRQIMIEEKIPEGSTCFSTNHMTKITFFSYPPLEEDYLFFGMLVLLLLILNALMIRPMLRSRSLKAFRLFNFSYKKKKNSK